MCGIFFSLSGSNAVLPTKETLAALESRGPDCTQIHHVHLQPEPSATLTNENRRLTGWTSAHLTFVSTVLALRGNCIQAQPLVDVDSKSVLCWNGEAWKINGQRLKGNDTQIIFKEFLKACQPSSASPGSLDDDDKDQSLRRLCRLISSISGPFSFIFYDANHARIFFSRDCLGRRSLLQAFDSNGDYYALCSISNGFPLTTSSFEEVEITGLHMIDLASIWSQRPDQSHSETAVTIKTVDWLLQSQGDDYYLV
jgi:asparagine synthetase B (glutamine-hydrolysing)